MSNKVCLILKGCKSLAGAINHNREHKKLDYVRKDGQLETAENPKIENLKMDDVHKFEREQIQEIDNIVKEKTGRKSQIKNHYVDGLISIGRQGFIQLDEEKKSELINRSAQFVENFVKKHNVSLMHFSVHFDEGHKDENGKWQDNPHIQFCFENINRDTGKAILSRFTKKDLQNLQTQLAENFAELGFERGKNYHEAGEKAPTQIYWKDFKRQAECRTKDVLIEKTKQLKNLNESKPQQEPINTQLQAENTEKTLQITQLHEQLRLANEQYNADRKKLKESGEAKQADYIALKKIFEEQNQDIIRQKNLNFELSHKLTTLEVKHKTLETAVEAFLSDPMIECKPTIGESPPGALKRTLNGLETILANQEKQILDLTTENLTLKNENSRLKTKTQELKINVLEPKMDKKVLGRPDFSTNELVLDYFEKINHTLVAKIRVEGKIDVLGMKGGTCYLQDKIPDYLAELLSVATGHQLEPAVEPEIINSRGR